MEMIFGICGILGGILCATGDLFLDLKGKDNRQLGKYNLINTAWGYMDIKRFEISILLAAIGVPLYFLGLTVLSAELAKESETFGLVFWLNGLAASIGGLFIHAYICLMPVVYKKMKPENSIEKIDEVINGMYSAVKIPFWVLYIMLTVVSSIMIYIALGKGFLHISPWCGLLTPIPFMIFGIALRKIKPDVFYDLPGIVCPSLGLSMMGLLAILNMA